MCRTAGSTTSCVVPLVASFIKPEVEFALFALGEVEFYHGHLSMAELPEYLETHIATDHDILARRVNVDDKRVDDAELFDTFTQLRQLMIRPSARVELARFQFVDIDVLHVQLRG